MVKSCINSSLELHELRDFLNEKVALYQRHSFIATDPIQIPHQFSLKQDIEIAAFLTATIAWGNRKSIINNANKMMHLLDNTPYDFVINHTKNDLKPLSHFVHRTFNGDDFKTFVRGLKHIYNKHDGLESIFAKGSSKDSTQKGIHQFKKAFFEIDHLPRTQKHVSDPLKNSAAKRINMFLRWMVRTNNYGVDFNLWNKIEPSQLSCPLDVHSGRVARKLGVLNRKQNDAKALTELDSNLRMLDSQDPVKYDYALFGLSAFENELF